MNILNYRELITNLVISELKTKYSNSVLGFAWSMLNPLLMLIVLYVVFSNIFKMQQNFIPYLLIGLLAWRFFANGTMIAMLSIVGKPNLVTKIFIPREILTLSSVLSSLISSILEFIVLIPLLIISGMNLRLAFLIFPFIFLIYFLLVYGFSLILSSLYVYYRDLTNIWDVILQVGFFLCPIMYPFTMVPPKYQFYYMLNPITRLINMYRNIFIDGKIPKITDFGIVILFGIGFYIIGYIIFNRLSRRFAEAI